MKRSLLIYIILIACCLTCSLSVYADIGPKPTLKVIAKNMPDTTCYLDLLVDYSSKGVHQNIYKVDKYNPKLFAKLKEYSVDGWRSAMVTGTMPPLSGDIICQINNGKCTLNFGYTGVPDRLKIIVVSADGNTKVSNEMKRRAFNSTVYFDYKTGSASESSPVWAYLLQFIITCLATLIIEGLVLLLFRFNLKQNYKPFIAINILTQVLLTTVVFTAMYQWGTLSAILLYFPFEIAIFIIEALLFAKYLKQHSKVRRVLYALAANSISFICGIMAMLNSMA